MTFRKTFVNATNGLAFATGSLAGSIDQIREYHLEEWKFNHGEDFTDQDFERLREMLIKLSRVFYK